MRDELPRLHPNTSVVTCVIHACCFPVTGYPPRAAVCWLYVPKRYDGCNECYALFMCERAAFTHTRATAWAMSVSIVCHEWVCVP